LKGGFLDGKEGFIWHILQGFWYRMLVDAKIYEIKKRFNYNEEAIKQYLSDNYLTGINRGVKSKVQFSVLCLLSLSMERRDYAA